MPRLYTRLRQIEYRWVTLSSLVILGFFQGGSRFGIGLLLKPMSEDLEWNRATLSLVITTSMLISAAAMPMIGYLSDRLSVKGVLTAGVAASAMGITLMGKVTSQWQAFTFYGMLHGVGSAGSSIATVGVLVTRWFPQRTGITNGVTMSGSALGQLFIIAFIASTLTHLGWRNAFVFLGSIVLIIVLPLLIATIRSWPAATNHQIIEPTGSNTTKERASNETSTSWNTILNSSQLWLLIGIFSICGFQDFFTVTHLVAFADDHGMNQILAGNLLALMGIVGMAGVLLSGWMADRLGSKIPSAICFILRIMIFAPIIYFQNTFTIVAFALVYGFTFMITAPLTVSFAKNIFGATRTGTIVGLIMMAHQVSGSAGAYIGAVIFDISGSYNQAFAIMLVLATIATLFSFLITESPIKDKITAH